MITKPTIKDVAKLAEVSIATVSRVLNGSPLVQEKTRQRVWKAIEKLNYKPNALARGLINKKTQTVGMIIPDISNAFSAEVVRGIEDIANIHNYNVILCNSDLDFQREMKYVTTLQEKQIDGLIFLSEQVTDEHLDCFIESRLPVVLVATHDDKGLLPSVNIDNVMAARVATEYLLGLGHRRIAFISGPFDDPIAGITRLTGYKQGLQAKGLPVLEELILEGDFTYKTGYRNMRKLLQLQPRPTAVFAASDEMAVGAMNAILDNGLKVPADIAVLGFDNIDLTTKVRPRLSTIAQPMYDMGAIAMQMLIKILTDAPLEKRIVKLPFELIIRESCSVKK